MDFYNQWITNVYKYAWYMHREINQAIKLIHAYQFNILYGIRAWNLPQEQLKSQHVFTYITKPKSQSQHIPLLWI
jgi:hypothetical protein